MSDVAFYLMIIHCTIGSVLCMWIYDRFKSENPFSAVVFSMPFLVFWPVVTPVAIILWLLDRSKANE